MPFVAPFELRLASLIDCVVQLVCLIDLLAGSLEKPGCIARNLENFLPRITSRQSPYDNSAYR
jgi:hypothetical protein